MYSWVKSIMKGEDTDKLSESDCTTTSKHEARWLTERCLYQLDVIYVTDKYDTYYSFIIRHTVH